MKKWIFGLGAALGLLLSALSLTAAENCSLTGSAEVRPVCRALDAQTTATASVGVLTAPFSQPSVQIWGVAGSSTVAVECRTSTSAPWYPCNPSGADLVNVDATGVYWTLPRSSYYRVNLKACTGCTVSANFELFK